MEDFGLICIHENKHPFCITKIFKVDNQYYLYLNLGKYIIDSEGNVIKKGERQYRITPEQAQLIFWKYFPDTYYHFGVNEDVLKIKFENLKDPWGKVYMEEILWTDYLDYPLDTRWDPDPGIECLEIHSWFLLADDPIFEHIDTTH